MQKKEYNFLTWTSFPSSLKLINQKPEPFYVRVFNFLSVTPGSKVRFEVKGKMQNVLDLSVLNISGFKAGKWTWLFWVGEEALRGMRTTDWLTWNHINGILSDYTVPSDVTALLCGLIVGKGTAEVPAITWFDDLKVYQDDVLIYSDDFSNWDPAIGAGVGAPIGGVAGYLLKEPLGPMVSEVVGAVLGGALGGGIGLLTGLGIIPVPQIPALGAAPEEPGAPARLGKYLVTG